MRTVGRTGGASAPSAAAALSLCLVALCVAPAAAQSLQRIFSRANEAYFQGDYAEAVSQYQQLVDAGVEDADVYYNLATAHARAGNMGKATLFFERSIRINPGDEAAEQALSACRAALGRSRAEKRGEATVQTRPPLGEALTRPFSENLLAWLAVLFDLAFFATLIALRLTAREAPRVALGVAAPLLGLLFLSAAAGLTIKSEALKEGRAAVVLREQAELREGPDPRARVRGTALEGQSARILAVEGDYARVRVSGGAEGWMEREAVGEI